MARPSLICLHTLLERNFNEDEVLFGIFPKVDIPYARMLKMFSVREWRRMVRDMSGEGKGKNECILRIAGKLEELEREEGTWDFVRDGEMW